MFQTPQTFICSEPINGHRRDVGAWLALVLQWLMCVAVKHLVLSLPVGTLANVETPCIQETTPFG